jgi:hypothetical protein
MAENIQYNVHINTTSNAPELIKQINSAAKQAAAGVSSAGQFGGEMQAAVTQAKTLSTEGAISPGALEKVLRRVQTQAANVVESKSPTYARKMKSKGGFEPGAIDAEAEYQGAVKDAAAKKRRQTLAAAQAAAADEDAIKETINLETAQRKRANSIQAGTQAALAADGEYLADTAGAAIARRKEAAAIAQITSSSDDYIVDTAIAAVAHQKEAALVQDLLATDEEYIGFATMAAAGRAKEAASVQAALVVNDDYIADTAIAAIGRQKEAALVADVTSTDAEYIAALTSAAVSHAREEAAVQGQLAASDEYIVDTAIAAVARKKQAAAVEELTSTDSEYISATARVAAGQQALAAGVQELLAANGAYIDNTARVAAARQQQGAQVQEQLAGDDAYATSTSRIASARQVQAAKVQEQLAGDTTYLEATVRVSTARQKQAADVQESLAGDVDYVVSTARVAIARQQQAADVQELTAGDSAYISATTRVASARAVEGAAVAELLTSDTEYIAATQRSAVARKLQEVAVQSGLADDAVYREATKQLAGVRQAQQATLQESLTADPVYTEATKRLAVARQEQSANLQGALAGDAEYKEATVRLTAARQRQQADLQASLGADPVYQRATIDLAASREAAKANLAAAVAGDSLYNASTARATVAREQQRANVQALLASDPKYAEATALAAVAREQQQAAVRTTLAADENYIVATAAIATAREEQAARVKLAQAGVSTGRLLTPGSTPGSVAPIGAEQLGELKVQAALVDRARANEEAAATARAAMREDGRSISAAVDKRIAESELAAVEKKLTREEMRRRVLSGDVAGTPYQKVRSLLSPGGQAPGEFAPGVRDVLGKGLSSVGYMAGGFASAQLLFGTVQAAKEASKLQEQFAALQGQMDAIGKGASFGEVRDGIKDIAAETGIGTDEVAKFTSRLLGISKDPATAIKETSAAMKLAAVSGLDFATMLQSIVPVATQFGVSIEHIGDVAVTVHDKFGIAEEATLQFLGSIAPMAEEAGLSLEEFAALGATAANAMGKPLGAVGDQFGKILPSMEQNQDKIYSILKGSAGGEAAITPLIDAFGKGQSGDALKILLKTYDQLDVVQQRNLIRVMASRREWPALNAIFAQSGKTLQNMGDLADGAGKNAGVLERRYAAVAETLSRSMDRLQQQFKNAVETIMSSGIGEAFATLADGVRTVLGLIDALLKAFGKLNELTSNIPGFQDTGLLAPLVQMTVGVYAASKALQIFRLAKDANLFSSLKLLKGEGVYINALRERIQGLRAGRQATDEDTASRDQNAASTEGDAQAQRDLNVTRSEGTAVTAENTVADSDNAAVRAEDAAATEGSAVAETELATSRAATTAATETETVATGEEVAATAASAEAASAAAVAEGELAASRGIAATAAQGEAGAGFANQFSHLPAPPIAAGGAGIGGAAVGEGGAVAGAAAGAGVMALALPVAIGAFMVKGVRDRQAENLTKQSDSLRDRFKTATDEQLDQYANQYNGFFDDLQSTLFQVDLPGELARAQKALRRGRKGAYAIGGLIDKGLIDKFANEVGDDTLKEINGYLNQTDENKKYALEALGANVEGNVGEKALGALRHGAELLTGHQLLGGVGRNEVNVTRDNLKQLLPKVKERAEAGDTQAAEVASQIETAIANTRTSKEIRDAVNDAVAKGDVGKAIEDAGGLDEFLKASGLYDPKGQLQTGKIGRGQYLAQMHDVLNRLRKQLASAPDPEKAQKELDAAEQEAQQISDQVVQERVDLFKKMASIQFARPKEATIGEEIRQLPNLTLPAQIAKIPELIQGRWDAFQDALSHAANPDEWLKMAQQGVDVDRPTQVLQIVKGLKDSPVGALADQLTVDGQSQDDFFREIAKQRIDTGKSMEELIYRYAQKKYQGKESDPGYAKLIGQLGDVTDEQWKELDQYFSHLTSPAELIAQMHEDQTAKLDEATINLNATQMGGSSPRAQAQAQVDVASRELQKYLNLQEAGVVDPDLPAKIADAQNNLAKAQEGVASVEHQTAEALDQWAVVFAGKDPVARTNAELRAAVNKSNHILEENKGDVKDPKYIESLQHQEDLRRQQVDNQIEIQKARMTLAAFNQNQDPEAAARFARSIAELDLKNAQGDKARLDALLAIAEADRQGDEARKEREKAHRELLAFDRNQNPVAVAQDAITEANIAISEARGKGGGAEDAAALQLKQALRQMSEAVQASIEADIQYAITLATIRQDPVGAAQLQVQDAQRKLAAATAANKGNAEIKQLMGERAQAQSNALDTAVQEQTDLTDYMLTMGQITTSQAIERLKVERDKYAAGTKKWRDLQLKIHSLEQGAKQDTAFNLPANITLPTLYEARRLNQSTAMGIGYMDNRNIALTFNVNGAQDPAAVSKSIMGALQGAMGGGQVYTPGISVGSLN